MSERSTSPMGPRTLPIDLDAERYVLAELLLRPESFDEIAFVRPEFFSSTQHQRIMEAVVALQLGEEQADPVAVATWLRDHHRLAEVGGTPYLAQLVDSTPSVGNSVQHARTVMEKWRLRTLIRTCQRVAAEGYGEAGEVQAFIERAENEIASLAHLEQRVTLELAADIMGRQLPILRENEARSGQVVGAPSGYTDLDRMTGGLCDGDLIILAGRPGMGKSAFASNLAMNVCAPTPNQQEPPPGVAFFSLEMPRDQVAMRIACALGSVEINRIRQNKLQASDWSALTAAVMELEQYPFWIDDTPALTLLELRSRVRKLKREIDTGRAPLPVSKLGLVVVDYLQLMRGQRSAGDNREREISSLSQGLKNLAKELGVPVLAASQLNRGVEKMPKKDRRPGLSDLRESGAIEQDADEVLFLYREHYYDRSKPERETELIVAKQRNGPTGTVRLTFELKFLKFYAAERDYYGQDADDLGAQEGFGE